ncbi:MAG TPA: hypothetical protein PKC70_07660 [Cellvibrionaceae bacterium]|nr:hypothetical protein [Cellvibrionaceae bacterium]HNG58258.1 hypothetical protein [Cellvibrionaceae bacterium]
MGRVSHQTEVFAVVRLLRHLCNQNELNYPIRLYKNERPDFQLHAPNIQIGIEHTEVVCPNVAQLDALRERGKIPDIYFARKSIPGEKKLSAKKLIEEVKNSHLQPPWMGIEPEENWAAAMAHNIYRKDSNYRFQLDAESEQWLILYDNWRAPALDLELALSKLLELIQFKPIYFFKRMYILSDNNLCCINKGKTSIHAIS